ncbi:MAG: DUF5916 domain-containing protein [Thermoanaerobaculia bacterium]
MQKTVRMHILIVLLAGITSSISASTWAPGAVPEVRAVRTPAPPAIDGDLSDPVWQLAPEITDFTQRDPNEGAAPAEKTSVRILYDDNAIYFAARLDDSAKVTSLLGRRDLELESDTFAVALDPHHDHRSGAWFQVNPANVQFDEALYNDNYEDPEWDGIWTSATKITPGGWTAEIRIPYSQLRFPDRPVHVWGINFRREINRKNERDYLVMVPKNDSGFVSRFANLTGIEGIRPKRELDVVPYVVSRLNLTGSTPLGDPLNSYSEYKEDAGVDVKYGLTSNLTLTGSINPDFGQVEVDPAVVNLSQFETFFPEKRPFFVEGSSLFQFGRGGSNNNFNFNLYPPSFFYSRRIGRQPQGIDNFDYDYLRAPQQSTILFAGKLTGKTASGWSIGAMDSLTSAEHASFSLDGTTSRHQVAPTTNYLVTRLAKDLGDRGRIGVLLTSVHRDINSDVSNLHRNAITGGTDGYWTFGNRDLVWEWFLGGSRVDGTPEAILATQRSSAHDYQRPDASHFELDPNRTSLSGFAARTTLAKQTGRWRYNFQLQTYSPGFETNDVGFMQRSDVTNSHAVVLYDNRDVGKHVRDRNFRVAKYENWNYDGDLIDNGIYGSGSIELTNYWYVFGSGGAWAETLDDRMTRGGPLAKQAPGWDGELGFGSDSRRKVSFEISYHHEENTQGTFGDSSGLTLVVRPSNNVEFRLSPRFERSSTFAQYVTTIADPTATATASNRYLFAGIDQRTVELGTRLDWTFTSRLSLQLYLQPFIASGDYGAFRQLAAPRTRDFIQYGLDQGSVDFDPATNQYSIDPDGPGGASRFTIANPDFDFRSLRGSAVLRWEFRPGSALFVVWNENRADTIEDGELRFHRDFSALRRVPSDDVFLVKLSYWLPM